jgi:drug/metabolite transporter (DMT)-like permease
VLRIQDLSFAQLLLWIVFGAALATWVFWHATRHGSRHATAWGIATFLLLWIGLVAYFAHYLMTRRRY